jgi:uncharacterized caspase-like protein
VVQSRNDVALEEMWSAINDFAATARSADIVVVYYAGHGIEIDGMNFLIPIDARLGAVRDVQSEGLSLDRVLQAIGPATQLRLIILDAGRANPFAGSAQPTPGSSQGVPQAVEQGNTLLAFATKAGSAAIDGDGPNSPFTAALLKHLATPGLDVMQALLRVRDEMLATTNGRQMPFVYGWLNRGTVAIVETCTPR